MTGMMDRIRGIENLPSLPTVAMEVLRLTQAEDVAVAQIAAAVQQDPALTAKLLRTANSPLFGVPHRIASLSQATVLLGLRAVKMMVLSFSLVEVVGRDTLQGFSYTEYWRRSLVSATAARRIGKATKDKLAEEAFIGGLLSDVGMLTAYRAAPEEYGPLLDQASQANRPVQDIEAECLGITHAAIGREMLSHWGLPEFLCQAVAAHHGDGLDDLPPETRTCATLVHCGACLSEIFCEDVPAEMLAQVRRYCAELTSIDEPQLETILEELSDEVRATASLLAVDVGDLASYARLQEQAASQLARLSIQVEFERVAASGQAREAEQQAKQLRVENDTIRVAATTDALTRVANRASFDTQLVRVLEEARTNGQCVGLILMDIDHFKRVNDEHGHQAGDAVLRHLGACLRQMTEGLGFPARYGGEEFAIIMASTTPANVRQLAEDIRSAIQALHIPHRGGEVRVTASFGAAWTDAIPVDSTGEALIQQADQLMYASKRQGRNRVNCPKGAS